MPLRDVRRSSMFDIYEQWLDHDKKEFTGSLSNWESPNKQTDPHIRAAIQRFKNAKTRCSNAKLYPTYQGIKVEFSLREFIYWWIVQNRFFKFNRVTLGRIDHSKNYTIDNIKLEEYSENSIEARERTQSSPWDAKRINIYHKGTHVAVAKSISQAAKYIDCGANSVKKSAENNYKVKKIWSFQYAQE